MEKSEEKKLDAAEVKVPRWSIGKTRLDNARDIKTTDEQKLRCVSTKVQRAQQRWAGHIERGNDEYFGKAVRRLEASGKRPKVCLMMGLDDNVNAELRRLGLSGGGAFDHDRLRKTTRVVDAI